MTDPILATPLLEPVAELTVTVGAPVEAGAVTGAETRGQRRIIPITGGSVRGRLQGRVMAGGADFQIIVSPTMAVLDARYVLALDNGEHVYVQNHALRRGPAEAIARLARGEPVDPAVIYFRCVPRFEVSSPALSWLTESIFMGTGARFPDRVELALFRVS